MSASLKQLAANVRKVWSLPERRAISLADVAILKLVKAVEDLPFDPQPMKSPDRAPEEK